MRKKISLVKRLVFLCVFLLAIIQQNLFAQNLKPRIVEVTIINEKGELVQGAVAEIKSTKTSIVSDRFGKLNITVKDKNTVLKITYTGYAEKDVIIDETSSTISVSISPDTKSLDEVVVIGYNTVKKKDVTGSVSGINQNDIKSRPVTNALEAMQGKVAGVDISSNERPGSIGNINIRGVRSLLAGNSPLFVVDGIPLVSGGIENFNPSDIESIDILKDASATAVYGSRGANGVVIVTTKQGKNGKVTLNLNSSFKFENLVDRETMFNAADYITFRRWAYYYAGLNATTGISTNPRGDQPTFATDRSFFNATADPYAFANVTKGWESGTWNGSQVATTDWRSMVTQKSLTSDNTISVSGGSDKIKTYASFGYLNNTGVIKGQSFQRYSTKVNVDITPTKWLSFGANINVAYNAQEYGQSPTSFGTISAPGSGLYETARSLFPYAVPYDTAGNRILFPGGDNSYKTIVNEWNYSRDQRVTTRAFGSLYTQIDFGSLIPVLKGLKYRMNFGPDLDYYRDGLYLDANSAANGGSTNYASLYNYKNFSYTLDNLLYYNRTIGDHSFGITLLQSQTATNIETSYISGNGVPLPTSLWNSLSSGTVTGQLTTATGLTQQQLLSYMARVNYSYKDKYLLTASIRRDGSSVFAKDHQYDNFPSVALAWRIDRENFMKSITWVNDLKLRAGVGITGNSAVPAYSTQGPVLSLFYPFSASNAAGSIPNPLLANPLLKWEKTTQYNYGVDFSLFKRRVSGSFDIYSTNTTDLLQNRGLPTVTGFTSTYANIAQTANNGFDITLTTVNIKNKNFTWTTTTNAAWQKDHIVSTSNGNQNDIPNNLFIGQPIGTIYGYKAVGLWHVGDSTAIKGFNANGGTFSPGFTRVVDQNGDNKIDPNNDRQIIGWTRPRWVVGMTNTLNYKSFDLSIFLYGRLNYIFNTGGEGEAARGVTRQINYYTENNQNADYEKPVYNAGGASLDPYYAALGYMKASFIKVRNISLGYTYNNKSADKSGISSFRAYMQITNPGMLFSQIKYLDMDVAGPTSNRGVTLGINASF